MARDPSRTTALRAAFVRQMNKRFLKIRGQIRKAIVADDVFALKKQPERVAVLQSPGVRAYAGRTSSQKVDEFMAWLQREVDREILEVSPGISQLGRPINQAWTNVYIRDGYERGVHRARYQLGQAGYSVPDVGGIGAAIAVPVHADRLGLLFTRTFNDLKGITQAMDSQISRVLAQGLADGIHPNELAKRLNQVITGSGDTLAVRDSIGRYIPAQRRAQMLARTEIIRAHAEAQLQEFENWGAVGVTAMAEWITAGDNRVCERCANLEGAQFTIEQARGMLPLHPSCRCAWIPFNKEITK